MSLAFSFTLSFFPFARPFRRRRRRAETLGAGEALELLEEELELESELRRCEALELEEEDLPLRDVCWDAGCCGMPDMPGHCTM